MKGLEEFENKIDKIASGHDDDSWIGQLYNQYSKTLLANDRDRTNVSAFSLDGLEPPMFDETWQTSGLGRFKKVKSHYHSYLFCFKLFRQNYSYILKVENSYGENLLQFHSELLI